MQKIVNDYGISYRQLSDRTESVLTEIKDVQAKLGNDLAEKSNTLELSGREVADIIKNHESELQKMKEMLTVIKTDLSIFSNNVVRTKQDFSPTQTTPLSDEAEIQEVARELTNNTINLKLTQEAGGQGEISLQLPIVE